MRKPTQGGKPSKKLNDSNKISYATSKTEIIQIKER